MEDKRPRERELVLAPNEYAYVLDTTKGHINCYVGPNKTSLAQTDQPVIFDEVTKRFEATGELSRAVQLFATAPANWYLVLKNPARDASHPKPGIASTSIDLAVGRKINVPGPVSFALWPGQMARVIEGHRLASNQYLVARLYDPEAAGEPAGAVGTLRIIKGTDTSFYVPPTGVEVVPDHNGGFVRDAVTLQRLEYCVLVGEDGKKRFVRGESVVFPEPSQRFLEKNGRRAFQAVELSEISGLYVKVIAPYVDDDGAQHQEGDELFLKGRTIYYPREEHAIIRYGDGEEVHQAVAIPAGEGRYVLNRTTGEIALVEGPRMLLPDPRREVITRRVLTEREARLFYPDEARDVVRKDVPAVRASKAQPNVVVLDDPPPAPPRLEGDAFARTTRFTGPRTLTLDATGDGAISIRVPSGQAVQVVTKGGARRVVVGPATTLLAYDETLESLALSTGTPKRAERLLHTPYLQVRGNQVSDEIHVVSADLVEARVRLKYRVSFEGDDPSRWFAVADYVKLLCDHAGSIVKAACRRVNVRALKEHVADVVRDAVLGAKPATGPRAGLAFDENGLRVFDVEVLDLVVQDERVAALLADAQLAAIHGAVEVAGKEAALVDRRRAEEIDRALLEEQHKTRVLAEELEASLRRLADATRRADRAAEIEDASALADVTRAKVAGSSVEHEAAVKRRGEVQALEVALLAAKVEAAVKQAQAYSPDLVAALQRLTDAQLLSSLAQNFGELAAVEGKGLLETARKFLDFVPAASLPALKPGLNGHTGPAAT